MRLFEIELGCFVDVYQLFARMQHLAGAILLESAGVITYNSRYHILSANPRIYLELQAGCARVAGPISKATSLVKLEACVKEYLPGIDLVSSDLPFVGGLLGAIGYEYQHQLLGVSCSSPRLLDVPDAALGLYDWAVIVDRMYKKTVFVHYGTKRSLQKRWHWWQAQFVVCKRHFKQLAPWSCEVSRDDYQQIFAQIQQHLRAGNCYQVNYARCFKTQYQGDEWQLYQHLSQKNLAPFSAFMRLLSGAVILSLSPERFLSVQDRNVETKPIKGTAPRASNERQDQQYAQNLLHSAKDKAENLMIVDLMRNDLSQQCQPGSIKVPQLFALESFASVHHLVSTVRGQLKSDSTLLTLLLSCFPGGSITGAPKLSAMKIIDQLEPNRRHFYCGSIGYISGHGRMDTNISIRTLVAKQPWLFCWGGGGIVLDSQVDLEYREIEAKLNCILPLMQAKKQSILCS